MENKIILFLKEKPLISSEEKAKIKRGVIPERLISLFSFSIQKSHEDEVFELLPRFLEPAENIEQAKLMTATDVKEYIGFEGSAELVGKALAAFGFSSKMKRVEVGLSGVKVPKKVYLCKTTV